MTAPRVVRPLEGPPDITVEVPGSKSITNRALVAAALAEGMSTISGALVADDTEAMVECLRAVGVGIDGDDRLLVDVTDDGVGLPAGFSLGESAGLGLSIVETLVTTELNGSIAMSAEGGTRVRLRIPLDPRPAAAGA